jgi:hypothetical protein
VRQHQNPLL